MKGYILLARSLQESEIWKKPSDWLKVWIHILQDVNHKDNHISERGEKLFNYKEISYFCGVSYSTVDHFIRWAKEARLLATRKATRGTFIKVLNYDVYQDSENYKSETKSETAAKQRRNKSDTINKNDKNDNIIIAKKTSPAKKRKDIPVAEHVRIVNMVVLAQGLRFDNKKEYSLFLNKNLRMATELKNTYSLEVIAKGICYVLKQQFPDWSLSAVGKHIHKMKDIKVESNESKQAIEKLLKKSLQHNPNTKC